MNRPVKIALGIAAAVAIFAVGVEYSPQVHAFIDRIKGKFSGSALSQLKAAIQDSVMKIPGVYAIGTHGAGERQFIRIKVKDEATKGEVQKFLQKSGIADRPIEIVIGEMSQAQ